MSAGTNYFEVMTALHRARISCGMTQTDVAAKIGTDPSRINEWENVHAAPSVKMLFRWAEALGGRIVFHAPDETAASHE